MTRCRGESIRATREVENSISISATFPSSLLKIFANGSVWYIWKPRDVPAAFILDQTAHRRSTKSQLTNSQAAIVLVKRHEVHSHGEFGAHNVAQRIVRGLLVTTTYQATLRAAGHTVACKPVLQWNRGNCEMGERFRAAGLPRLEH